VSEVKLGGDASEGSCPLGTGVALNSLWCSHHGTDGGIPDHRGWGL